MPAGTRPEQRLVGFREERVACGTRTEKVQVGTRTERRLQGYETRMVACGTECQRYVAGRECREVVVGTTAECFVVKTCEEEVFAGIERQVVEHDVSRRVPAALEISLRRTGWRTETEVVCPATTRTVTERVTIPCRRVTVVPDGAPYVAPLPGTEGCMTQSEFAAALGEAAP
jgi:hypothetical protein